MPNTTTWLIVANSSHAKIFRITKFPKIEEITSQEHPESRLHNSDLVTTRPGRAFESTGTMRHAYQAKSDPHQLEVDKFAKSLSEYLGTAQQSGKFSRLYVMATPVFLGLLRKHMNNNTQETIVGELAKDMTDHTSADIEQQLAKM